MKRRGPVESVLFLVIALAVLAAVPAGVHAAPSDVLEIIIAPDVLFRSSVPCNNRVCGGSRSEDRSEFPGTITITLIFDRRDYVSNVLSLFEEGDPRIISDRVRIVPRFSPAGTDLSVTFLSDSNEQGLPFGPEVINLPEDVTGFQDLTGSLFSLSSQDVQDNPPFRVLFNSDCDSPCFVPPDFPELPVAAPASVVLLGIGLIGLAARRWSLLAVHSRS